MLSDPAVVIGIASAGSWSSRFGACLVRLSSYSSMMVPEGVNSIKTFLSTVDSSVLSANMSLYVDYAMAVGASHLLTLEVDMTFPPDALNRLLERDKDIVGCNYVYKKLPPKPMVRGFEDEVIYSKGKTGLERVASMGFGITLIKMDVFKKMEAPYFQELWLPKERVFASGDTYFCQKARDCGFDIWVDHDLSNQAQHIGALAFTEDVMDDLGDLNALADSQ